MCGCCCVKVSLNLLANLLQRISDDIMELIYCQRRWPRPHADAQSCSSLPVANDNGNNCDGVEDQYQCQKSGNDHEHQQPCDGDATRDVVADEKSTDPTKGSSFYSVIYDTVELEPYYHDVDRAQSEEFLKGCSDGSCLVRPFKFKHTHIRYILSIHAARCYFHLFIRRTGFNSMYALGLEKQKERHFKFPADIVQYYRIHLLECASVDKTTIKIYLKPLGTADPIILSRECEISKETIVKVET